MYADDIARTSVKDVWDRCAVAFLTFCKWLAA